jgi:hypothetical protein
MVWGFNEQYLVGIFFGSLPIEEDPVFSFAYPMQAYSLIFCLESHCRKDHSLSSQELISSVLIILLLIAGIYNIDKWYTGVTFITLALFLPIKC